MKFTSTKPGPLIQAKRMLRRLLYDRDEAVPQKLVQTTDRKRDNENGDGAETW